MFDGHARCSRMLIGKYSEDSENVILEPSSLLRHVSILGTTGSGKTVMGKVIIEECTLEGIPSIISQSPTCRLRVTSEGQMVTPIQLVILPSESLSRVMYSQAMRAAAAISGIPNPPPWLFPRC